MKHWYLIGPYVVADGKLVFTENRVDLLLCETNMPASEALALAYEPTGNELSEFIRSHNIMFANGGIGFDVDRLDEEVVDIVKRIKDQFGWIIVKVPLPHEVFDVEHLRRHLRYKEELKLRVRNLRARATNEDL